MSTVPPTPPTPPTPPPWPTAPFPPLPSRRELRRRAFALHCHGVRPRAIGERLGIPGRTICDWIAKETRILGREHEQLDRDMRQRDVIACCYTISAAAWDRYEHLSDRAQALLAFAFGEETHDDGTPLSPVERRRAAAVADRLRAALPRYLLLAHHAQREVARVQQLYDPSANALPEQDIQYISSPYEPDEEDEDIGADEDDDEDDEEDEDAPSAYGPASASVPTPAAAANTRDEEEDDEDEEDDLPDDDTDMRALEAFRDRLEEYFYHLRQQRAQRAQRAAAATHAAASPSDPSPVDGGGVARSAGVGESYIPSSLSAPDRPATLPDDPNAHEIATSGETPPCEIENLAETATTALPPAPPETPPCAPAPSQSNDLPSQDPAVGQAPDMQ